MALIISTPLQFMFELFCIYLVKVKVDSDKASETNKLLMYQVLITLIFAFLQALFIKDLYNVFTFGRPNYVLTTFFMIWLFDNLKSVITLALVHCIVVRRFMHLEINENAYADPNAEKIHKSENAIPKLKIFCLKFLESTPFESVSLATIAVYTVFLLFWLVHEELMNYAIDDTIMAGYD